MKNCEQMKNLSVLEHGLSVHNYFLDLYNHILLNTDLKYEWKLPEWVFETKLWESLEDFETIKKYQIYHDCGKPFFLTIDDEGRKHFPNHAQVSSNIWREISESNLEADLMLHDMDIHLMKSKDVDDFCQLSYAATLLITGLAELHSNASMFGGIESTSFKIKWKSINKFGKRITQHIIEGK
jgi:hypothetical protein